MTKDNIITLPNPRLRSVSKKILCPESPSVARLIADMQAATIDWENSREHEVGVALAAIQIGRPLRAVVIRNDFDNKQDHSFSVFLNPVITKYEGEQTEDYEGCLSVRDIYGKVTRYSRVRVKATDMSGREFRVSAEGFMARVFQHEIDHCNGIVFVDHIKDKPDGFYRLAAGGNLEPLDYEQHIRGNTELW